MVTTGMWLKNMVEEKHTGYCGGQLRFAGWTEGHRFWFLGVGRITQEESWIMNFRLWSV